MAENSVTLIGFYGGDITHATAAWTSTGGFTPEKEARIPGLLKMLADNGHMTPFERSFLHFNVVVDIATHIQLVKHRVIAANGESARYKELKDDRYYVPMDWPPHAIASYVQSMERSLTEYHEMIETLVTAGVSRKRAKESARFLRPYGTQIAMDISMSFRAFLDLQRQRNTDHAQLEIHELTARMLPLVGGTRAFDHSLTAFGYAYAIPTDPFPSHD